MKAKGLEAIVWNVDVLKKKKNMHAQNRTARYISTSHQVHLNISSNNVNVENNAENRQFMIR